MRKTFAISHIVAPEEKFRIRTRLDVNESCENPSFCACLLDPLLSHTPRLYLFFFFFFLLASDHFLRSTFITLVPCSEASIVQQVAQCFV